VNLEFKHTIVSLWSGRGRGEDQQPAAAVIWAMARMAVYLVSFISYLGLTPVLVGPVLFFSALCVVLLKTTSRVLT